MADTNDEKLHWIDPNMSEEWVKKWADTPGKKRSAEIWHKRKLEVKAAKTAEIISKVKQSVQPANPNMAEPEFWKSVQKSNKETPEVPIVQPYNKAKEFAEIKLNLAMWKKTEDSNKSSAAVVPVPTTTPTPAPTKEVAVTGGFLARLEQQVAKDTNTPYVPSTFVPKSAEELAAAKVRHNTFMDEFYGRKSAPSKPTTNPIANPTPISYEYTTHTPTSKLQKTPAGNGEDKSPGPGWIKQGNRWVFRGNQNSISDATVSIDHASRPDAQVTPDKRRPVPTVAPLSIQDDNPRQSQPANTGLGNQLLGEAVKQTWKTLSPTSYTRASQAMDLVSYGKDIVNATANTGIGKSVLGAFGKVSTGIKALAPEAVAGLEAFVGGASQVIAGRAATMLGARILGTGALAAGPPGWIAAGVTLAAVGAYVGGRSIIRANTNAELDAEKYLRDGGPMWQNSVEWGPNRTAMAHFKMVTERGYFDNKSIDSLMTERVLQNAGYDISKDQRNAAWDKMVIKNISPIVDFGTGVGALANQGISQIYKTADTTIDVIKGAIFQRAGSALEQTPDWFQHTVMSLNFAIQQISTYAKTISEQMEMAQQENGSNLDNIFYGADRLVEQKTGNRRLPKFINPKRIR